MEYEKLLVSPKGREFIARSPAEANDLMAQGYTVKQPSVAPRRRPTPPPQPPPPQPEPAEDTTTP